MTEMLSWDAVCKAGQRSPEAVAAVFTGRTEAERKALLPEFKAALTTYRQGRGGLGYGARVLRISGAGCLGGPAGIAGLLRRAELADFRSGDQEALYKVLSERSPEWTAEVATRLAAKLPAGWWGDEWKLVDTLARRSGLPAPAGDNYLLGWINEVNAQARQNSRSVLQVLHADRFTAELIPRLFEVTGVGTAVADFDRWMPRPGQGWWHALREMSDSDFLISRKELLEACVSRLLRGERPGSLRAFCSLHDSLEPTVDELSAFGSSYLRLLPDALGSVAGFAQKHLKKLDEAGRLSDDQMAEACQSAFFRTEKTLVRTQLTWLDRSLARHPGDRAPLLSTAVLVFQSETPDLQERAVKLIAKHLKKLDDGEKACIEGVLRDAVPALCEAMRSAGAALIGETAEPVVEDLPELYVPPKRELPPPIGSVEELAEELAVFFSKVGNVWGSLHGYTTDPVGLERIVAALLRENGRAREALAVALTPLAEKHSQVAQPQQYEGTVLGAVGLLVTAVCSEGGDSWRERLRRQIGLDGNPEPLLRQSTPVPQRVLLSRLYEIALRLRTSDDGPYLAEPADAVGYVDPAGLVQGLKAWEALGREPWKRDLEQALMRLPQAVDKAAVAEARTLTSDAGKLAARVLEAGGLPQVVAQTVSQRHKYRHPPVEFRFLFPALDGFPGDDFAELKAFHSLHVLKDPLNRGDVWRSLPDTSCWTMILPGHRDVIAMHTAPQLSSIADEEKGGTEVLPLFAEADGPVGPGLSLVLSYGLAARQADDRTAAVDAFLTLAARKAGWDPAETGRHLAQMVDYGQVKVNRLTESLRALTQAGAYEAVWQLMTGLLPGLASTTRGLGDLLQTAAECAGKVQARGSFPWLDELAATKKSSRIVVEAKRLHQVLSEDKR